MEYNDSDLKELFNRIPGGMGIFNVYRDGKVEQVYVNDGFHVLLESARMERKKFTGFAAVNSLEQSDLKRLMREITEAKREQRSVNCDVRILSGKNIYKWINIQGSLANCTEQYDVFYALFSDIDKMKNMHLQLESSRSAVSLAGKQAGVQFWTYYVDRREIVWNIDLPGEDRRGNQHDKTTPEELLEMGEIHPEDREIFLNIFKALEQNENNVTATVRVKNHEYHKFEWLHIIYTGVKKNQEDGRVAVGCAMNVDQQQENQQQYEHELQLKHELLRDSLLHYQINLTAGIMEEYDTEYPNTQGLVAPFAMDDELVKKLAENIPSEVEKRQFLDTFSMKSLMQSYREGKHAVELEYRRYIKGKGLFWLRGTGRIVKKPNTEDMIALIYIQDIDEEKKMKLAINSVVDEEVEYVVLLNVKTKIARIVKEKKNGRQTEEHRQFAFDKRTELITIDAVVKEDRHIADHFFHTASLVEGLRKSSLVSIAYRYEVCGKIFRKKTSAFYLDETGEEIVVTRRDITDLYDEEERKKMELQRAVDAANVANEAKSEFLSRMSHDIRTPMNAIIGITSLAMDEVENPEAMRDYLAKINSSSRFLLGLVNDCLDMEKIESKRMTLKPQPYVYEEFENAINTLILPLCREKDITFSFVKPEGRLCVLVDKVRFEQIFINILTNAVKYTPRGGTVEFYDYNGEREGNQLTCRYLVRDSGIGMSEEFQEKLFTPFTQESSEELPFSQGSGLGLCIVKNIVEMMNGKLEIKSEKGKGTEVFVEVKMEILPQLPEKQPSQQEINQVDLKNRRILLVEDHPLNTEIAKKVLEGNGMIVTCAENGKVALDTFVANEEYYFDAILMDIRMPVMDGLTSAREIRALNRADAGVIPIIAMTANAFDEDVKKSMEAGMNRHLAKPMDIKKLLRTLREVVTE